MLKRFFCWIDQHQFDLADMSRGRDRKGFVCADCIRCGGHFQATHGLGLPGTFVTDSRAASQNEKDGKANQ
jgi:hypothetical protein